MTRIAILTPSITTGDAVSNDVLEMHRVLHRYDYEVRVYTAGWTFIEPKVWPVSEIKHFLQNTDDVLIYHYSMGWNIGLDLIRELKCRTVIKYHNVTPPEFFDGISEAHVAMSRIGRQQLKEVASAGCDLYLADSEYNMRELISEGVYETKSFVVPPFHHIDRLNSIKANSGVLQAYRDGKTNILMVGRVAPNKGHAALIEAFATYYYHYNSNSRLLIVGKEDEAFSAYSALLRRMVAGLELQGAVVFTGGVSDEALKAYYMVADVFMIISEHEGFCVPLVEAMAMKVPIVAYGSSAIPGTVGKAGMVWKDRNPYLMAESINFLVKDKSLSAALGRMGWQRYEQLFTNERIETELLKALKTLL